MTETTQSERPLYEPHPRPVPFRVSGRRWTRPCDEWGGYRSGTCSTCGWDLDGNHEDGA